MKQIVWLLLLFSIGVSAQGVYPHQFTEKTTLTDSDWETYSQKSGLPRRISPTTMSAYFLKGVRAYVSGDVLYFSRRDSISSVSLAAYKQTLSVAVNGGGQTTVSISGGNTITLPAASVGDIEVEAPIEGTGSSSDPLGITDLGIATGKIADNAVTYGKIQQVTSGRLLGRYSAGSGTAQEITLGSGLSLSIGGELSASGGGGGITALTGDVTAAGTGSVAATIANDAVTSVKIASQTVDSLDIKNRSITLPKYARSSVVSTGSITGVVFKGNGSQAVPSFDSVLTYLPSTAITDGTSSGFWKIGTTDRGLQYYSGTTEFLDYHGRNFVGDSYALRRLTESTGSVYVLNNMSISGGIPSINLGVTKSGLDQGFEITSVGVKNRGATYQIPSGTAKVTTHQITGKYTSESFFSGDVTTTINLPEIVSGAAGTNQVEEGFILDLSVDKASVVTISRTGGDVFKIDGTPGPVTSMVTTGGTFWAKRLRAIDANTWEVIGGGSGSLGVSEYNVAVSGANSGSNLRIKATSTGVTASYASNKITVVIPGGTKVFSADWRLVSADIQASADAAGTTNWVLAEFQGTGGNTSVDDLRVPNIQKTSIPTSGALSVTNSGSVDIDNNPAISIVGAASGNIIIRVGGLSAGGQGYHLKFTEL